MVSFPCTCNDDFYIIVLRIDNLIDTPMELNKCCEIEKLVCVFQLCIFTLLRKHKKCYQFREYFFNLIYIGLFHCACIYDIILIKRRRNMNFIVFTC